MSKKIITFLLLTSISSLFMPATHASTFEDVNVGDKYYISISYLQENGIIEGYGDNTFRPYENINRSEALKMLTLASGVFTEDMFPTTENNSEEITTETEESESTTEDEQPFTDTSWSDWFTPYLAAAKDKNIIEGLSLIHI